MLFVDSSEPADIAAIFAWGVVSGVTTNPLIMARAGVVDLEPRLREILGASKGPVSIELLATDEAPMLAEADAYVALDPARVVVKVPFSETGLRVTKKLVDRGVHVNVTCCMSFNQAYLGALTGARYVSIFSGRVRDMGYDVRPVIEDTREQLDREGLQAELIVGSIRHLVDVNEALSAGAHVVTVPVPILRKMLHNPKTDETIREFNDAWKNRERGAE
jgi:transaldolase